MSSHHKHQGHAKAYEYKIVGSHDLKKKDAATAESYLNELGGKGWDLVTVALHEENAKGFRFIGLMKRKVYRPTEGKKRH
jgi:hypothetical protein